MTIHAHSSTAATPRCPLPHVNLTVGVTIVGGDYENNFVEDSQLNLTCTGEGKILNSSNSVVTCTCRSTSGGECSWFPEISKIRCLNVSLKENGLLIY